MPIDDIVAQGVARAVRELYGVDADPKSIVPQTTRKEFEGNLTVMVFPWVKAARKAPEAGAQSWSISPPIRTTASPPWVPTRRW